MGSLSLLGIAAVELLGMIFIVLKLSSNIAWSWWWVLLPIWVFPALLLLAMGTCMGICMIIKPLWTLRWTIEEYVESRRNGTSLKEERQKRL